MAKNIYQGGINTPVKNVGVQCTFPASPVAGGVGVFGDIAGIAEADMDATSSITTLNLECIAEIVVSGTNGGGNVAVTAGDTVYASKADPVVVSKVTTGVKLGVAFGNALTDNSADTRTGQLVASGATTTKIRVLVGRY